MNSVCIIIPYFGKLPNYFQLWLESCKNNDSFTWLVFTVTIESLITLIM